MQHLRRIALAIALPAAAVAVLGITTGVATSSPGAGNPRVAATDENPAPPNPNIAPTQIGPPQTAPPQQPPLTLKTLPSRTLPSRTATKSPTSMSPSATSASPSKTSGSPSPSGRPGGIVPVRNCTGTTVSSSMTVQVGTAGGKQALVDSQGCALYLNTQDTPQASACTGSCLVTWPPLNGPAQAGQGVQQSNLATVHPARHRPAAGDLLRPPAVLLPRRHRAGSGERTGRAADLVAGGRVGQPDPAVAARSRPRPEHATPDRAPAPGPPHDAGPCPGPGGR